MLDLAGTRSGTLVLRFLNTVFGLSLELGRPCVILERFWVEDCYFHVIQAADHYEIWLNTADLDGMRIGEGKTREEAVTQAVAALEAAASKLQEAGRRLRK